MRYSARRSRVISGPTAAPMPSVCPFPKTSWHRSRPTSRSKRPRPYPPPDSSSCRTYLTKDRRIDYTKVDFTQSGERYDLIFDIPGNHPFSACRRVLTPNGKYVLIGHDRFGKGAGRWLGSLPRVLKLVVLSPFVSQLPPPNFSMPNKKDSMALLRELLEAGKLTPVVDRSFSLGEVSEAIRYLEEGRARGKVVITVRDAEGS